VPNTVIDAKTVGCRLSIATTGVIITRSQLLGISGAEGTGAGFRVEDTTIDVTPTTDQGAIADGISGDNYVARRVNVYGSNRGVYCHRNATIADSWIHGTEINPTSNWHASGLRVEQGCNIIHNTLACDWLIPTPADGGCSADLTGYPDFAPIKDNLIQGNLFVANPTGAAFCAYGGATGGKPYSGDPTNATNIRFIDNVFQVGPDPARGECADFGPITDFAVGRPGNVWSGNVWDDGSGPVLP
jgi:hypothetical protein